MKKRLITIVAALACIVLFTLTGCAGSHYANKAPSGTDIDESLPTVKIAYLPITHALALFEQVEELNADPNRTYNIELVKYGTWPELMDALNTGKVDGAPVLVELGMRANEQGIGLKAVALGHRDGNIVVARNDIESTADLAGKTIAIPARQSSHYILVLQALANVGLSESDVTLTELAPTEMPSALASGQIDAYCVAEPFGAKAVEVGVGHVIENSEDLWEDSLCCALVFNPGFINSDRALATRFVTDYKAAGENLSDKTRALEVALKYLNQSEEVLSSSLEWISFNDLSINEETYADLAQRVKEDGLSKNPPTYEQFVENLEEE